MIDHDLLGEWLCERQLPNGGLNGRPEKLEDVCYSWWVLSSLAMIDRLHWIDRGKLISFILSCQVCLFLSAMHMLICADLSQLLPRPNTGNI